VKLALAFMVGVACGAMPFAIYVFSRRADRWLEQRIDRFLERQGRP
jgi:hypothetical protein